MSMTLNPSLLEMALQNLQEQQKVAFTPPGQPAGDPAAAGGAPMDPSMMGGAGGMPMDPSTMGGAGGAPMDPSMMGGAGGMPMDPSMMGGAPPAAPGAPMAGGDGKPKKVDPAVIDAKLYQILKIQVLICSHLNIQIPPELVLGIAPDPMAAQQATASNQQMEAQSAQTLSGLPQGGGAPGGAEMPKTGEALDEFSDDSDAVRIGTVYNPQALLDTAMLADVTGEQYKQAHHSESTKPGVAQKVRNALRK